MACVMFYIKYSFCDVWLASAWDGGEFRRTFLSLIWSFTVRCFRLSGEFRWKEVSIEKLTLEESGKLSGKAPTKTSLKKLLKLYKII
jgi:hypothetical protein